MIFSKRRAKVVCTIGPACDSREMLVGLLERGMNVARFNFSHGGPKEQSAAIERLQPLSKEQAQPVAVLQDLQGPRIRLGEVAGNSAQLREGTTFVLTTREVVGDSAQCHMSYDALPQDCRAGDTILINDGLVRLKVLSTSQTDVECEVQVGGEIRSRKGINLPGVAVSTPALSSKDRRDALWGVEVGVDFIALSFVRDAADILALRKLLKDSPHQPQIIAKIEKPEAIDNLEEILQASDGVMVARGDLGVEVGVETVPLLQKHIIARANATGKLVITATQMLESMCENATPTRAEASDVANAVLDGTDAVMLSAETAAGNYPLQSLATMSRIIEEVETRSEGIWYNYQQMSAMRGNFPDIVCHAAAQSVDASQARCIVVFTESGTSARRLSKFHPTAPIYAFTCYPEVARSLQLAWGVQSFVVQRADDTDEMLIQAERQLFAWQLAQKDDPVIIILGAPVALCGSTNLLKLHRVGELSEEK